VHAATGVTRGSVQATTGVTRGSVHATTGVTRGNYDATTGVTHGNYDATTELPQGGGQTSVPSLLFSQWFLIVVCRGGSLIEFDYSVSQQVEDKHKIYDIKSDRHLLGQSRF
jgi:hypothetical protein